MVKFKFQGVKPEVDKLIKDTAEIIGLYDPRFHDEDQCSGFHAYREMCLMRETLCTFDEFETWRKRYSPSSTPPVGYYLINQLHPNIRYRVIDLCNQIKGFVQRGEAGRVKVVRS